MTGFDSKRQAALDKLVEIQEKLGMTKQTEALKLALEALEEAWYHVGTFQPTEKAIDLYDEARTAIKAALAQPEQKPVAWGYRSKDGAIYDCISPEAHADCEGEYNVPLYTTPQQRTWVGLTDVEAAECWTTSATQTWKNFESALRSKNI